MSSLLRNTLHDVVEHLIAYILTKNKFGFPDRLSHGLSSREVGKISPLRLQMRLRAALDFCICQESIGFVLRHFSFSIGKFESHVCSLIRIDFLLLCPCPQFQYQFIRFPLRSLLQNFFKLTTFALMIWDCSHAFVLAISNLVCSSLKVVSLRICALLHAALISSSCLSCPRACSCLFCSSSF